MKTRTKLFAQNRGGDQSSHSAENRIKAGSTILCELFTFFTLITLLLTRRYGRLLTAFSAILLFLLPSALERIFHCRLNLPLFLFALLYALGSLLGSCWTFYDIVPGWDKILHTCGGVVFAILGFFFFQVLSKNNSQPLTAAVFALCFSITLSVLWEFWEFGFDVLFHTDMQRDTLVFDIYSHMLNEIPGEVGGIDHIESVIVNGTPMPAGAYLDIGLIDTMLDMLVESAGALLTCLAVYLDKGRHPLINPVS